MKSDGFAGKSDEKMWHEQMQINILVQVIAPGMVNTDANRKATSGDPAKWAQAEEIANHVIYFLSDQVQRASGNAIEIPHLE